MVTRTNQNLKMLKAQYTIVLKKKIYENGGEVHELSDDFF